MEKLPIKIIAIDLDDTLLKDDLTISDYSVDILQKAAEKGIYIVIASGRTDNGVLPHVRRLKIAGSQMGRYIIVQNGAAIIDLHERRTLYERFVTKDVLIETYRLAKEFGLTSEVYDASTIYTPKANEWVETDVRLTGLKMDVVEDYEAFLEKGHPKMVVPGDATTIVKLEEELKRRFVNRAVVFTSKPYFLEVLPYQTGKGEALEWLSNNLGIAKENTMCFGDSMNDESMIRYSTNSVAMKNGKEEMKQIARFTTEYTNNEDGLARFVEKYVL